MLAVGALGFRVGLVLDPAVVGRERFYGTEGLSSGVLQRQEVGGEGFDLFGPVGRLA